MRDAYRESAMAGMIRQIERTHRPNGFDLDGAGPDAWPDPEPLDLDEGTPAVFPLGAFPPLMERTTRDIADGTKCPAALAAASVLSVASFSVQNHFDVEFARRQRRPLCLFILTIAASGERKSTVDRYASKGVYEYQAQLVREQAAQKDSSIRSNTSPLAQLAREQAAQKEDMIAEAEDKADQIHDTLPDPNIVLSNMTLQGVLRAFSEGQTSLALFSDDGGEFLGGYSMKAENRLGSLAGLSKYWDGGLQTYKLRGSNNKSETLTADDCRLAIHLQAQPVALHPFLSDPMAKGQGILARALVHKPASTIGTRFMTVEEWGADGMTPDVLSFASRVQSLLGRAVNRDGGVVNRQLLRLAPEAKASLVNYANEVERSLAPAGDLEGMSDLANKMQEQAARIAGTLTAFEDGTEVSSRTMDCAIRIARYFLAETVRLARIGPKDEAAKDALNIADWLNERGGRTPRKTFSRCGPKHLRRVQDRQEAFSLLKDANWMREADGMLELNPRCAALGMVGSSYGANTANGANLG